MNYLAEILAFENWVEYNSGINKSDIRLWYTLMHTANRFGWHEFTIPISTLIFKSKLSKSDIYRSRNKLKQFGILDFKERTGNQSVIYKMNSTQSLYGKQIGTNIGTTFDTDLGTASGTTSGAKIDSINKTRNQKLETKKESIAKAIPKKKFGEFKNVLLTQLEYECLETDYEADLPGIIEHFSSYIEMKGYKAKSHNLAIRNWVATAYREKKQRELALKSREEAGIFANKNSGKREYFQNDPSAQKWLDQAKKSGY